jgi:sec-independent protein translocase protein TatC
MPAELHTKENAAEPAAPDPFAHTRMTLGEHLDELRKRLFRGVLAVGLAFVAALYFNVEITEVILQPFRAVVARLNAHNLERYTKLVEADPSQRPKFFEPDGTFRFQIDERLSALTPTESMWFVLKVAGYSALVIGAPILLWQLWQFVAAGLYARERRWVVYFFPPALLLFVGGVLFSYFLIVPYGMFYSMQSTPLELVKPEIRLEDYFEFLLMLCLSMGLVFQLPILMMFLGLVGIVPPATFARMRGYFVIAAFALAAVLTPGPDVFSQVAMAAPMIVLYEIGILGARFLTRGQGTTSVT